DSIDKISVDMSRYNKMFESLKRYSKQIGEHRFYKLNQEVIEIISKYINLVPDRNNIIDILSTYNIESIRMFSYNGKVEDYMHKKINNNELSYQDIENIDSRQGLISSCNAYYINMLEFFGQNGLSVGARHIDLRADFMT